MDAVGGCHRRPIVQYRSEISKKALLLRFTDLRKRKGFQRKTITPFSSPRPTTDFDLITKLPLSSHFVNQ